MGPESLVFICEKSTLEERGSTILSDAQFTDPSPTSFTLFLEHYISQMWFLYLLIKKPLAFLFNNIVQKYLFLCCGSVSCKHSFTAVSGGRKFHLKYLPAGILGGKDPPPGAGCGAWRLFKNPALRKLGQNVSTPMAGKDPFKR